MRIVYYVSSFIAAISVILAIVARLFLPNKSILGLSALSYLRVTNTMLLFAIAALVFEYIHRKKTA